MRKRRIKEVGDTCHCEKNTGGRGGQRVNTEGKDV